MSQAEIFSKTTSLLKLLHQTIIELTLGIATRRHACRTQITNPHVATRNQSKQESENSVTHTHAQRLAKCEPDAAANCRGGGAVRALGLGVGFEGGGLAIESFRRRASALEHDSFLAPSSSVSGTVWHGY